jgi:hypothetical protein
MSRDPLASSSNDTESALSDDELEGVVGGRTPNVVFGQKVCTHSRPAQHSIPGGGTCNGPFDQEG